MLAGISRDSRSRPYQHPLHKVRNVFWVPRCDHGFNLRMHLTVDGTLRLLPSYSAPRGIHKKHCIRVLAQFVVLVTVSGNPSVLGTHWLACLTRSGNVAWILWFRFVIS